MVQKFLFQNEVFFYYDRNTFEVWNPENSSEIKCTLKCSYEPYILKIDEIQNYIAVLIESREQGQELLILKINFTDSYLKIVSKIPVLQRVFDIKFSKNNTILLINIDKVCIYNYIIKKFFRDSEENFFQNCKMLTFQNDSHQYLNVIMKKNEQLIRIFSVNPQRNDENYFIQLFVSSSFFDKIEKHTFICNNTKNSSLLIYKYMAEERKLTIIGNYQLFQMNNIKYLPEYKVLLNIEMRQQNIVINLVDVKKMKEFFFQELGFQIRVDESKQNEKYIVKMNSLHFLENPVLQENFTDLFTIKIAKKYKFGYITQQNSKFHFKYLNVLNHENTPFDLEILLFSNQSQLQLPTEQQHANQLKKNLMRTVKKM
ncbi:hypothetical protein TTHERM_00760760 (macronuclear) [Tetrahymena thermophila SB210]|uniref:Uncharacterized protein n=1 Tax=Tetrahymena thermophila (strain SB210) TaxID=312017 RepID=I7M616_TETTS|nr:hypothetical protein TTHERM_00760760 [Tetrahymena thermophila SB210]EAR84029.2 hypothetical protein TTHERM_00760760 [Tetrahymena thermophila SB210]|eukprot:XP_001031692.2 hypothetical protein TTHERM_00760760 [Tetrahymena thermophila SB210]